jgi:7-keto-8-aminopelargonate synthetase-like enzyme
MSLKKAYLYLVSTISLVIAVIGAIMLINLALKAWVFTKADQNYYSSPCPAPITATAGSSASNCDQAAIDAQKLQNQENQTSQRQNTAAQALAMIIVATPVWLYHWKMARKEV